MKQANKTLNLTQIFKGVFRRTKKHCAFCGKHYSEVANLIAGNGTSICNECVLICSGVLLKQCEVYRISELHQMRDFLGTSSKAETNAAPNGAPAISTSNSAVAEKPPTS